MPTKTILTQYSTWLHWLDNNVNREGITKNLESMREQGVLQVTILNTGLMGEK